jgi:hypothetical protein
LDRAMLARPDGAATTMYRHESVNPIVKAAADA